MDAARYSENFRIEPHCCNTEDKLKYSSLFSFMQDTAARHCTALGFGRERLVAEFGVCYVIVRMNVRMLRIPVSGERMTVTTWPENRVRKLFMRYFTFTDEDGNVIGNAVSQWVLMDLDTRSVVNPASVGLVMPDTSEWDAPYTLGRFALPEHENVSVTRRIPVCIDFDDNGHVNNARYLEWIFDAVPKRLGNPLCIDIQYKNEIQKDSVKAAEIVTASGEEGFTVLIRSEDRVNIECKGGMKSDA